MKMAAGRSKDDIDVGFLVGESGADLKATREIVKRHLGPYAADAADELDRIVDQVEWQRSRDQKGR